MRDDDELSVGFEFVEHPDKSADVRVVQRSVHFVEQAERARLREKDSKQQRQRDQCTLSAREKVDSLSALARGAA